MKKKNFLGFIVCLFICLTPVDLVIGLVTLQEEGIPVIIGFKESPNADIVKAYGGKIKYEYKIIPAIASSLPERYIELLRNHPKIAYVRLDGMVEAFEDQLPWGVDRIDAERVWGETEGATDIVGNAGLGIRVAIIDTGVDYDHPDLASRFDPNLLGFDFVNEDPDPMDDNGHGTHCAGTVAAEDNAAGVIGVAPKVTLYALKALDSKGTGFESDLVEAIEWCVNNKVHIISMSLGSYSDLPNLHAACDEAYYVHGILIVAAAGNMGRSRILRNATAYPANYDSVIAVGATDTNDKRAAYSSTGPSLELTAPGDKIYSTNWDNSYATMSGTSMACPHVVGTAALVWAAYPDWNNVQIRQRLQATAKDLGTNGRDYEFGYGVVNASAAATVAPAAPNNSPVAKMEGPYYGMEDEPITFNASGSHDPDGDPLIYKWDFGDGSKSVTNTTTIAHTYVTGEPSINKTYSVNLIVNDGKVDSEPATTMAIIAGVNDPPIAHAGGPYSGAINKTIVFNASKSSDEEGIATYTWDFGDRTTVTVDTPTTTHAYMIMGTYGVTLTITDLEGVTATDTTIAEVTEEPIRPTVCVSINMSRSNYQKGFWMIIEVTAVVTVLENDPNGLPIEGTTIYCHWSGVATKYTSGKTNTQGTFQARYIKVTSMKIVGMFTFTIDRIEKDGKIYNIVGEKSDNI